MTHAAFQGIDSESAHDSSRSPGIDSNWLMTQAKKHLILSRLMIQLWIVLMSGSIYQESKTWYNWKGSVLPRHGARSLFASVRENRCHWKTYAPTTTFLLLNESQKISLRFYDYVFILAFFVSLDDPGLKDAFLILSGYTRVPIDSKDDASSCHQFA